MTEYVFRIVVGGLVGLGVGHLYFLLLTRWWRHSNTALAKSFRFAGHYGKWSAAILGALPLKMADTGYAGGSGLAIAAWVWGGVVGSAIVFVIAFIAYRAFGRRQAQPTVPPDVPAAASRRQERG